MEMWGNSRGLGLCGGAAFSGAESLFLFIVIFIKKGRDKDEDDDEEEEGMRSP